MKQFQGFFQLRNKGRNTSYTETGMKLLPRPVSVYSLQYLSLSHEVRQPPEEVEQAGDLNAGNDDGCQKQQKKNKPGGMGT